MLTNAERAVIEPAKIRDYLLSPSHPVGRFKAAVFASLGYTQENWQILHEDLLALVRSQVAVPGSLFQTRYEPGEA